MPITTEDTLSWLQQLALVLQENREYLTQLDSAIGDADHGINMDRGFKAVAEKLPTQAEMDIGSILKLVGTTLVSTVGGASGPLYGTAFLRAGMAMAGKRELYEADYIALLEAALEGIKARGKAQPGEKTMLDAFAEAQKAMRNTAALKAKDLSFTAFLARQRLSRRIRGFARMMVEGFDAADPARASARAIVEEWRGGAQLGAQFRPLGGYGELLECLARGVRIQMHTVARAVRWKP